MIFEKRFLITTVLAAMVVCGSLGSAAFAEEYNATYRAKANAGYCMTCGCKRVVHTPSMGSVIFSPGGTASSDGAISCNSITTSAGQYAEHIVPRSIAQNLGGYYCRLKGRYKTTDRKGFDCYAKYKLSGEVQYRQLERIYLVGVSTNNGENGWQEFQYDFNLLDIPTVEDVSFFVRSPDADNPVLISGLSICTYFRDEFKQIALLKNLQVFKTGQNDDLIAGKFRPFTTHYSVLELLNSVSSVDIKPEAKLGTSTITVKGVGVESGNKKNVTIQTGPNSIPIEVKVSGGISMSYLVKVEKGTNGDLSSFTVTSSGNPTPDVWSLANRKLKSDNYEYSVEEIPATVSSITLAAEAIDPSVMKINDVEKTTGTYLLDYGDNKFTIESTPPAGSEYKRRYTIHIRRGQDVSIRSLSITDNNDNQVSFEPVVARGEYGYSARNINPATVSLKSIVAVPTDIASTVKYFFEGSAASFPLQLDDGKKEVRFLVESAATENPMSAWYTVTLEKGHSADLAWIIFKANQGDVDVLHNVAYNVRVLDVNATSFTFTPKADDAGATLKYTWENSKGKSAEPVSIISEEESSPISLPENDDTKISLIVKARDGYTRTYDAIVERGVVARTVGFSGPASISGEASVTSYPIPVELNNTAFIPVTIDYLVDPTSTALASDFSLTTDKKLSFSKNDKLKNINLTVTRAEFGSDKTVILKLVNPTNGLLLNTAAATKTFTIFSRSIARMENEQGTAITTVTNTQDASTRFKIKLDHACTSKNILLDYTVTSADDQDYKTTATSTTDYQLASGKVFFQNGATESDYITIVTKGTRSQGGDLNVYIRLTPTPVAQIVSATYPNVDNSRVTISGEKGIYQVIIHRPDLIPPTLSSTVPVLTNNSVCLNSTNQLTVKGTATDESGIKEVGYDIYQNGVKQTPSPDPLLFTTNSKTESWTFNIQNIPAGKSQIVVYAIDNADKKTSGSGNISFDVFTTCGNLLAFSGFTAGQSIPNSGCIIQWTADATISSVDLLYTLDGGTTWTIIGQDISANTASILWSYMVDNVSNAFKLKIRDHDKPDLIFTESPTMKLTGDLIKPEANSVAYELQTITIKWPRLWGASGAAETVDIYRNLDGVETLLKSGVANSGDLTWQWEIPQFTHSENAKIKIVSSTDPTLYSVSGAFKIFRNNFLRKYYLDLLY